MKRISIMLVGLVVVALGVFWTGSGTAQNGDIPVLQTQVAELDARLSAVEARVGVPSTEAASSPEAMSSGVILDVSGVGLRPSAAVHIVADVYSLSLDCGGDEGRYSLFAEGTSAELASNASFNSPQLVEMPTGQYIVTSTCPNGWTLTLVATDF